MAHRIEYEQPEQHPERRPPRVRTGEPNPLRDKARPGARTKRGRSTWRYTRAIVAQASGLGVSGVRAAERRGELVLGDDAGALVSMALFVAARVKRRK